ncbi:MAG TPA: LysM peptidoglycan-binding domain-containing protein, partial [Nitrospirales bacterium]|nr:LysM peptidoglycan-binding domain-containing protein [Nitrospirales bacterium]
LMSLRGMLWGVVAIAVTALISGCVTRETYESQVKRATNLQRLLADEEKKRNVDVRKLRRQVRDMETQNLELEDRTRELSAQVIGLQDAEARMQEEMGFLQLQPTSVPDIEELTVDIESIPPLEAFGIHETAVALETEFFGTTDTPIYHEIQRGDTLWNIARRYNTKVHVLKDLNGLTGNQIYGGQSLIVGYQ